MRPLDGPILLATANAKKVAELRAVFAVTGIRVASLDEIAAPTTEPPENGDTFERNAVIKAEGYARQTGMPCLADDSGLVVDALGGAPGVISSHYCTGGRDTGMTRAQRDEANNRRLLLELRHIDAGQRTARFVCVMALALPPGPRGGSTTAPHLTRGAFEGAIGLPGDVPRGANGFGYDPLFLVAPDLAITSAELDPDTKNRLSHRGQAARAMAEVIRSVRG
jgi:XTP/dITP diphosphohydrolase